MFIFNEVHELLSVSTRRFVLVPYEFSHMEIFDYQFLYIARGDNKLRFKSTTIHPHLLVTFNMSMTREIYST